jgi:transcriptional regulator with XRE-family HTH domain
MKTTIKINPERIVALRTKHGFSQKELAGKVGVDSGTVSRWERVSGKGRVDRLRQDIFGRLCVALDSTADEICGGGPLPQGDTAREPVSKGQMNLSIDTACRNALSLVALRYGVTRQQIVEAAPLLFFIAAEQSLSEREKRLRDLRDEADAELQEAITQKLASGAGQSRDARLGTLRESLEATLDDAGVHEVWLGYEEASIENRDPFGSVAEGIWMENPHPSLQYADGTAIAAALTDALAGVSATAEPVRWEPRATPRYRICADEAQALVGDDNEAAEAILSGAAALHDMPSQVRKSSPAERAQWARSELQRNPVVDLGDL